MKTKLVATILLCATLTGCCAAYNSGGDIASVWSAGDDPWANGMKRESPALFYTTSAAMTVAVIVTTPFVPFCWIGDKIENGKGK
ncbi:TPA: hypothetical protein DDW35_08205 [Candidatus Sumerlaeota bacterium]|nr:hypothetical protein [Candidatus Sumerlaeota bacterium]